jgi:hypothetical protein
MLLTEAGLVMQALIVGIYWPFVHEYLMNHIKEMPDFTLQYWTSIFKHSYPAIAILANTIISKVAFIRAHYLYCFRIGTVYAVFNYWGTLQRGRPLYPFMTWESVPFTIVVCIGLMSVAAFLFVGVTKLVNSTKTLVTVSP